MKILLEITPNEWLLIAIIALTMVLFLVIWIGDKLRYIAQQKKLLGNAEYYLSFVHISSIIHRKAQYNIKYWSEMTIKERETHMEQFLSLVQSWQIVCKNEIFELKRMHRMSNNHSKQCTADKCNELIRAFNFLKEVKILFEQPSIIYLDTLEDIQQNFKHVLQTENIDFSNE